MFYLETFAHWTNFKNCIELHQCINHDIYPAGIDYTIVNRVVVVERERLTGAWFGHVLRQKPKWFAPFFSRKI